MTHLLRLQLEVLDATARTLQEKLFEAYPPLTQPPEVGRVLRWLERRDSLQALLHTLPELLTVADTSERAPRECAGTETSASPTDRE
jgi:hypothetical protein